MSVTTRRPRQINHAADRQPLVHGDHAGHGMGAGDALKRMSSHGRHVVREKNPILSGGPRREPRGRRARRDRLLGR